MQEEYSQLATYLRELMDLYFPTMIQFITVDAKVMIGDNSLSYLNNALKIINCYLDILRKPVHKEAADGEEARDVDPLNPSMYYSLFSGAKVENLPYYYKDMEL